MPNDEGVTKSEKLDAVLRRFSIRASFVIRHPSFVILPICHSAVSDHIGRSRMQILINFLLAIYVLVALLMVLVILMQRPKSEGLGAAFGAGVTENIFGAQTTNVLVKFTAWLTGIFFLLTFFLSVLYSHKTSRDTGLRRELLKQQGAAQPSASPAPANPNAPAVPAPVPPAASAGPTASAATAPPVAQSASPKPSPR